MKIIGLLARHFLLCLHFWWVELQIRVLSSFSCHLVRWQIRLIRFSGILGLFLLAFLSGCSSAPKPLTSYAPSPAGVLRAVTSAKASATALRSEVTTPAGLRTLAELNSSLDSSLLEVAAYSAKVDTLSLSLTKAEESATYWHDKQEKAMKELWLWRIVIIAEVGAVLGYVGIRMGWKLAL